MASHWCKCDKCGSKIISKTTWYAHNHRRKHHIQKYTANSSDGIQRNSSWNIPLSNIDVKELSMDDEEDEEHQDRIEQDIIRSDSVSAMR